MNKFLHFTFIGLFLFSINFSHAQEWKWAKVLGQPAGAFGVVGMSKLSNDEIAVLGYTYESTIQFDEDIFDETGKNTLLFVSDLNGNYKKGIKIGKSELAIPMQITSDKNDNIFIAGNFNSVIYVAGNDTLFNQGNTDGFIVKLDKDLNIIWAKLIATPFEDDINAINVDNEGNIYVAGLTTKDYGNNYNNYEAFLMKLSPDDNLIWEKRGTTTYETKTTSILIDQEDNCFWTFTTDSINFNDGKSLKTTFENYSGFINKISPNGQWLISENFLSIDGACLNEQDLYLIQIAEHDTTYGLSTVKYNTELEMIWKKDLNGFIPVNYSPTENSIKIAVDENENIYLAASVISEEFVFANDTFIGLENQSSIFILKYDFIGDEIWAKTIGKTEDPHNLTANIIAFGDDKIVLSGNFYSDSLKFGEYTLINNNKIDTIYLSHGAIIEFKRPNMFIASLGKTSTAIHQSNTFLSQLYPNPVHNEFTLVLPETNFKKGMVEIYSINGALLKSQVIHSGENNILIKSNYLPSGLHLIYIHLDNQYSIQKIIKK